MSKRVNTLQHPAKAIRYMRDQCLKKYIALHNRFLGTPTSPTNASRLRSFEEVRQFSLERSDINEHLPTLFAEALRVRPNLIVELGVRGGVSTLVFERVARLCGATLVSVDLNDCSQVIDAPHWHFVQADDVAFSKRFPAWCEQHGLTPQIDVLFIDTSHYFDHTVQEIEHWFPLLAPNALVFFHDTNQKVLYKRQDRSLGLGWENHRGVIRALEAYFGHDFLETLDFTLVEPGWIIRHYARCSGLTILEKLDMSTLSTR
jgi:predicted O-methyltransferase YrrM